MFITPSFKKSLIVEQFQGNYLKGIFNPFLLYVLIKRPGKEILSKMLTFQKFSSSVLISFPFKTLIELNMKWLGLLQALRGCPPEKTSYARCIKSYEM